MNRRPVRCGNPRPVVAGGFVFRSPELITPCGHVHTCRVGSGAVAVSTLARMKMIPIVVGGLVALVVALVLGLLTGLLKLPFQLLGKALKGLFKPIASLFKGKKGKDGEPAAGPAAA